MCARAGDARNGSCAVSGATNRPLRRPRAAHGRGAYFDVEVLPLLGLELPGVPGTAPEVGLWPVPVDGLEELPEVSLEDPEEEPEDMPLLLGLLDDELPEPDVP